MAREVVRLTGVIALVYLLYTWVLLDLMSLAPITSALTLIGLGLIAAIAFGLVDLHLLGTLAAGPLLTVMRFPRPFTAMVAALLLPIGVLELHPFIGPWPGAVAACAGLATLLILLRGPRRIFGQILRLANEPLSSTARTRRRIYRFLRGEAYDEVDPTTDAEAELLRRWDLEDQETRGTLFFNAAGWYVAWICFFIVLQLGTLFRTVHLLEPGAFLTVPQGGGAHWSWLMYSVETFVLRGELAFEIYEIYEIDAALLLGHEPIRAGPGLNLAIVAGHLSIVLLLADAVLSHFRLVAHLSRLIDRGSVIRYEQRFDNVAYGALRVLRPLAEPLLLRRLRREGHPTLRLLAASLLRSARGRRFQRGLLLDRTQPFQVRLAALRSLLTGAEPADGASLAGQNIPAMLAELALTPSQRDFEKSVRALGWLVAPRVHGRELIARAWCWDVLCLGTAASGWSSAPFDPPRLVDRIVTAAEAGTRIAFLDLLTHAPDSPRAFSAAFTDHLETREFSLDPAELEFFHRAQHLQIGTRTEQLAAAEWLHAERLGAIPRELVSDLLLRQIDRSFAGQPPYPYLAALARVGSGERVALTLLSGWLRQSDVERWATLLGGLVDVGAGVQEVFDALLDAVKDRDQRGSNQGPAVDLVRWVLWRALCRQAAPEQFADAFGRRPRATSFGHRLWKVPAGTVTVRGEQVEVPSFWAAETPVTPDDWRLYRPDEADGRVAPSEHEAETTRSAVRVSWWQARAFCAWLTEREREQGRVPDGWEFRLPTEPEWQRAAQGGRDGPFWFGQRFDARLIHSRLQPDEDRSPAMFRRERAAFPNAWGITDILGNVWEWCLNEYSAPDLCAAPLTGSTSPRALRGGAWCSGIETCSALVRAGWDPDAALDHVGFRFVLAPCPTRAPSVASGTSTGRGSLSSSSPGP